MNNTLQGTINTTTANLRTRAEDESENIIMDSYYKITEAIDEHILKLSLDIFMQERTFSVPCEDDGWIVSNGYIGRELRKKLEEYYGKQGVRIHHISQGKGGIEINIQKQPSPATLVSKIKSIFSNIVR